MVFAKEEKAQQDDGPPAHNFDGTWSLRQSNGYVVTMVLTQNGRDIAGTSSYYSGKKGIVRCTVNGKGWHQKGANGWPSYLDHFQVEVVCNGAVAVYNRPLPDIHNLRRLVCSSFNIFTSNSPRAF